MTEAKRHFTDVRLAVPAWDVDGVARAFAAGGAVHITGALDPRLIAELRAAAESAFAGWSELAAANALPAELEAPFARRYVPFVRMPYVPSGLFEAPFQSLARSYLGKEPETDPNSHVRSIMIERTDAHLPYHQDQAILKRRLLNIWIPLDPCGVDAPGLEVVWGSWREMLEPAPAQDATFPVERARLDPVEVLRRYGAAARWSPAFALGDAMVFSGATIHRTHIRPGMTRDRMSAEIRLF